MIEFSGRSRGFPWYSPFREHCAVIWLVQRPLAHRSFELMAELEPWIPLSRRSRGLLADETLYEDVPEHLQGPLQAWHERFALTLPIALADSEEVGNRAARKWTSDLLIRLRLPAVDFQSHTSSEQLDIVDGMLRWAPEGNASLARHIVALDEILLLGGSAWRVRDKRDGLERRLDRTVANAANLTISAASQSDAGSHLEAAWAAAYGRRPDPDKVFNEAIRAVESIACPLVEPARSAAGRSTLGSVIGELGNSERRWELTLPGPDGSPGNIAPLIAMLRALWQAQVSRHGGAPKSRRQDQDEGEAAIHLSIALVQWLQGGVLRRRAP